MRERKRNRKLGFDYSTEAIYFLTICCKNRIHHFGKIENKKMILNEYGKITETQIQWLEKQYPYFILHNYIVMPNHVHILCEISRYRDRSRPVPTARFTQNKPVPTAQFIQNEPVQTTQSTQNEPVPTAQSIQNGPVPTTQSTQNKPVPTAQSTQNEPVPITQPDHTMESAATTQSGPTIQPPKPKIKSISELMGAFKTTSSKKIHLVGNDSFQWQRSFHDHIVRNDYAYQNIDSYITKNPEKWVEDTFNK